MIARDLFAFALSAGIFFGGLLILWRMGERMVIRFGVYGYVAWYAAMLVGIVAGLSLSWEMM
mgnify:CR=1 FL=1